MSLSPRPSPPIFPHNKQSLFRSRRFVWGVGVTGGAVPSVSQFTPVRGRVPVSPVRKGADPALGRLGPPGRASSATWWPRRGTAARGDGASAVGGAKGGPRGRGLSSGSRPLPAAAPPASTRGRRCVAEARAAPPLPPRGRGRGVRRPRPPSVLSVGSRPPCVCVCVCLCPVVTRVLVCVSRPPPPPAPRAFPPQSTMGNSAQADKGPGPAYPRGARREGGGGSGRGQPRL